MRIAVALGALVVASLVPAGAGERVGTFNPLDPAQGPSPNTVVVSGTGCSFESLNGAGAGVGAVLGGPPSFVGGDAFVQLFDKDDPNMPVGAEQGPYGGDDDSGGEWSGPFLIPADLDPGVYPAEARCEPQSLTTEARSAGLVLLGQSQEFDYPQTRSYTVLAQSEKADPVQAEVTLTG